jgi:hypothetical protein
MSDKKASLWRQCGAALRRYLLLGTGISSTALGLALIVSFFAAAQGGDAVSEGGAAVEVSQVNGRYTATTLDEHLNTVSPELAPWTASFELAPPAPPLDVEREAPATPEASPDAAEQPAEAVSPSPPAAELDPAETPEPLDAAAASLQAPVLAQELAEEKARFAENPVVAPPGALPVLAQMRGVNVTFYDCWAQGFCGHMYNGQPVYEGAAACSWDLPLGTEFVIEDDPTQRVYVCADRGLLSDTWVDIFFWNPSDGWAWQKHVGRYATIHIVSLPSFDPPS